MGTSEHINLTRRKMILTLGWLVLIPIAGLWDVMVKRDQTREESKLSQILFKDIPQGISYYGEYWIRRRNDGINVFSSRCTHLGCRIKPAADGQLICPCHGSVFDQEDGTAIKGPAEKSLQMLNFIHKDDYLIISVK